MKYYTHQILINVEGENEIALQVMKFYDYEAAQEAADILNSMRAGWIVAFGPFRMEKETEEST